MKALVITRDRVTYAQQCIDALLRARLDVIIVDHDSTWLPMRDLLDRARRLPSFFDGTPRLIRDVNRHPRDLWRPGGPIEQIVEPGERFIVTDCDVVPDRDCPSDWVELLGMLLNECPAAVKVGLGLRTDDLPAHFTHRHAVQEWERAYQPPRATQVGTLAAPAGTLPAAWADIDTTLAMYRRYEPFRLGPAIRTTAPYLARHLTWYEDTANPTDEQAHYRAHAEHGHWRNPEGFRDDHALGGHA